MYKSIANQETERTLGRMAAACHSSCRWPGCGENVLLVWTEVEGLWCSHLAHTWCHFAVQRADIYKDMQHLSHTLKGPQFSAVCRLMSQDTICCFAVQVSRAVELRFFHKNCPVPKILFKKSTYMAFSHQQLD